MSNLNVSQDMFDESSSSETLSPEKLDLGWLGVGLQKLKCNFTKDNIPVKASNHTVLFKLPMKFYVLKPYPETQNDVWDNNHVRMPHSPQSLYPVSETRLERRWPLIKNAFKKRITTSKDLESAIFSFNSKSCQKWRFDALHEFFCKTFDENETNHFFKNVFPYIIELALDIENKITAGIPLLKKGINQSISMSQEQAAVLLANAFLCTYPRRNSNTSNLQYPGINFNRLFQWGSLKNVQEKLRCLIHYFNIIRGKSRCQGVITFTRRCIETNNLPIWSESQGEFSKLHISHNGTIEEDGAGMLEIDFANKFVGGGILGRGSVQEEIKFLICPELVVSRLFTECLEDNEALIVTGCERYSNYKGYGETFEWAGNYEDMVPRDLWRRKNRVVVAIDAVHFSDPPSDQYKLTFINRELNKAYTGFSFGSKESIATGNWGCGAFNGDPKLKFLIQLMAASVCKKNVAYFTFGDITLRDELFAMYECIKNHNVTVGMLWRMLSKYHDKHIVKKTKVSLYDYLYSTIASEKGKPKVIDSSCNELKMNNDRNDLTKNQQPIEVPVCSLKTDEGRKRCIETDKERWEAYQDAMSKHSNSDLKNTTNKNSINKSGPVKRKISDYFTKANNE